MIARRLGAAAGRSQSLLACAARSPPCAVASTSYSHHPTSSPTRSFISSSSSASPGPFAPTSTRRKKNRAAVLSELPDKEPFEEYEDEDGDLFDMGEEKRIHKPAKKTTRAVQETVRFPDMKESIMQRFKEMDPDEAVNVDLSDWSSLVRSASTAEELKQCFEVSLEWKNKTYSLKSKLQKLTTNETGLLVRHAGHLRFSEVMLDALMNRKSNGLEYDIGVMRQIQAYLVLRRNKATASDSPEAPSDQPEGSETSSSTTTSQLDLAQIDRCLALAAFTSTQSPSQRDVDPFTLILAIAQLIKLFHLNGQIPSGREDFYRSQVYPRFGRALTALSAAKEDVFKGTYPLSIIDERYFSGRCKLVLQVASSKRQAMESLYDLEEVSKSLSSAMEAYRQYVKEAKLMSAASKV